MTPEQKADTLRAIAILGIILAFAILGSTIDFLFFGPDPSL